MRDSFGPLVRAVVLWLCGGVLAGCGSSPLMSAVSVCDAYDKGALVCSGRRFDTDECKDDLPCVFELYRSEAIDFFVRCADRYNRGECPSLEDYVCAEDRAALAALEASPRAAASDYESAFTAKQDACAGTTLDSDVYSARGLARDEVFTASRPCLDGACGEVNGCLRAALSRVAPSCR